MGDFLEDVWNTAKDVGKVIAPFAGGGLSFLGGLLTNQSNADIARANRHFVRNMYKKRYQFTVDDMRKAGLNPVLAANGGSVGSVPSVSTPTMSNALEAGVSGALSTARAVSDLEAQQVSNAKTEADARLADAQNSLAVQRSLAQKIENQQLPFKVEYIANKALAESSLAESNALMARARAGFAYENAQNEAFRIRENAHKALHSSYNEEMRGRKLYNDVQSMLSPSEKRIWNRVMQGSGVVGKAVNSAVGVGKLRWLFR